MVADPASAFSSNPEQRRDALLLARKRTKLTDKRKTKIHARIKSMGLEIVLKSVVAISKSDFHRGDNDRNWKADLEWLMENDEKVEKWANQYGSDQ